MTVYYRPIVQTDAVRPSNARPLAGGWCWFDRVERIERAGGREIIDSSKIPADIGKALTAERKPYGGIGFHRPSIMGILNVTPDSFSDGGRFVSPDAAISHGCEMVRNGADIIDIGGESTRPGAEIVPESEEILRIGPVIEGIRKTSDIPISIDTRKSRVASFALEMGASMINDVSAFSFDMKVIDIVRKYDVPVCLMHAQGDPKTMQENPNYENVLLDVFDYLQGRVRAAVDAGIPLGNIIVDPGIGFGKSLKHNLELLRGLSLFHALGCPIVLGASRKRFIGTLGNAPIAADRMAGSVAVTLAAVSQGVQIHRVHDIKETRQALSLWMEATGTRQ